MGRKRVKRVRKSEKISGASLSLDRDKIPG